MDIVVSQETNEYLNRIEIERQRKIDEEQRRWYEMKQRMLGDSIKQEYPSTPEEAFESANEGLYYGSQISKLREKGAICAVPYDDSQLVHTAWDIGVHDYTSIWCFQLGMGGQVKIINFYENHGERATFYCDWLNDQKYKFGRHIFPHDGLNHDANMTTWVDLCKAVLQGKFVVLPRESKGIFDGINIVRSILGRCVFDEKNCRKGLMHLESYRKLWDDKLGCYHNQPLHDMHSHASDAFRMLSIGLKGMEATQGGSIENDLKAINRYFS
jgi:hypothetical protein